MNNSRYLLLMDYARVDYLARLGLLGTAIKKRWTIPVGSAQLKFRRSTAALRMVRDRHAGVVVE